MTHRVLMLTVVSVLAACVVAAPVGAGLLPVSVSVAPEAGNFRWTYAIVLPTDSQLRSGDYFTIYDFGGLVPGSIVAPDGWTTAVSNTGSTPNYVDPNDNPVVPNLTFTYTGSTLNTGQTGLGNFWAVSTYQNPTNSFFAAQTHRTSDGQPDSNVTGTVVPVPSAPPSVPEPTTLALAALGLPLIGWTRRVRRKSSEK